MTKPVKPYEPSQEEITLAKKAKPYEPRQKKIAICPICGVRFPEDMIFTHLCWHIDLAKCLLERSEIVAKWYKCVRYVKNQHRGRPPVAEKKPFAQGV